MVAGRIFPAQHGNMMVRAVHRGAHQVRSAGVTANILFMGVLLVGTLGDEHPVGAGDKTPHLGADCNIAQPCGDEHFLISLAHAFADCQDIARLLVGAVGNSYAAGQVDERDFRAGFLMQLGRRLEQDARKRRIIAVFDGVRC